MSGVLNLQARLLRVVQEQEVSKVGSPSVKKVDVRIISATNRDLSKEIAANRFREDLFYRLNVIPIHVPALRERPEDIPLLAEYFLRKLSAERRTAVSRISEKAILDVVHELRLVDEIISKHGYQKSALIQILLDTQSALRWLPRHALKWISERLKVPLGDIYSIATFYETFSLTPQGAHSVQVCMGTACHVRGAPDLLRKTSALLGIEEGQTDDKQMFTLKTVHCLGCCALSPVVQIDEAYFSNPSLKELKKVFESLEAEEVQK